MDGSVVFAKWRHDLTVALPIRLEYVADWISF